MVVPPGSALSSMGGGNSSSGGVVGVASRWRAGGRAGVS